MNYIDGPQQEQNVLGFDLLVALRRRYLAQFFLIENWTVKILQLPVKNEKVLPLYLAIGKAVFFETCKREYAEINDVPNFYIVIDSVF